MELTIKDIIAALTLYGALIIFYAKIFCNFFMSIIKINYKEVSGKQTMFEIIIQWMGYIGFIIIFIINLTKCIKDLQNSRIPDLSISNLATGFIIILSSITFVVMCGIFGYLYLAFQGKLKGEIVILDDIIEKVNKISVYIFIVATILSLAILFNKMASSIIVENEIYFSFKDSEKNYFIMAYAGLALEFGVFLLISINLKEIIKTLKNRYLYIIYFEEEEIYSSCFLELKDYYLVIKNGNERYINKSKVKEIRKIKTESLMIDK